MRDCHHAGKENVRKNRKMTLLQRVVKTSKADEVDQ
jgi:hypothetical protein